MKTITTKILPLILFVLLLQACSKEDQVTIENDSSVSRRSSGQTVGLHVLSYNLYHLPGIAASSHYKEVERSQWQLDVLRQMKQELDVIVFQEGFNQQVETHLFDQLVNDYPYSTVLVGQYCYTGGYWNSISGNCSNSLFVVNGGVRIFSKYPILEKHQLVFYNSGWGTADYYSNKGAAYVSIEKEQQVFHIVGTHLQADQGSYNGGPVRMGQIQEIHNWVLGLNIPAQEPVIYAGDFNVEYTDTPDYNQMFQLLNGEIDYTFDPSTDMGTYSNQNTMVAPNYPNYNNSLDYIFYDQDYKAPMATPQMQVLRFMKNGEDISDHFPVRTDYVFQY